MLNISIAGYIENVTDIKINIIDITGSKNIHEGSRYIVTDITITPTDYTKSPKICT